ncbi:hypothetical protein EMIT0P171_100073 [Pseudomonas sp. IT-P171]
MFIKLVKGLLTIFAPDYRSRGDVKR